MDKSEQPEEAVDKVGGGEKEMSGPAWKNPLACGLTFSIAIVGFIADYLTKRWAVSHLGTPDNLEPMTIIENYVRFYTQYNDGAVASSFSGKTTFLICVSFLALGFIVWLFASSKANQHSTHIALGMILAGALGNMYDRIFHDGKVIDFIEVNLHVRFADPWPIFNIADILLCIGVGILLLTMLLQKQPAEPSEAKK